MRNDDAERHEFWGGSQGAAAGSRVPWRTFPRCSCGWHGGEQVDWTRALLAWVDHVGWATAPGCTLVAERWIDENVFEVASSTSSRTDQP